MPFGLKGKSGFRAAEAKLKAPPEPPPHLHIRPAQGGVLLEHGFGDKPPQIATSHRKAMMHVSKFLRQHHFKDAEPDANDPAERMEGE